MIEKIKTIAEEIKEVVGGKANYLTPFIDQAVIRAKQDEIIEKLNILIEKNNEEEKRRKTVRFGSDLQGFPIVDY